MSTLFGNLNNDGLEESQDRLGGGFQPRSTDIYNMEIVLFYAGQSKEGAKSITIHAKDSTGLYRETIYITNKKGENFFLNRDDNSKKVPLPGFTTIDDICLAATGFPLASQEFTEKVFNLYDFDQKKEVPTKVMVALEVMGKTVSLGIQKVLEDKTAKNASTGEYEPTGESKETNSIAKVFHTESKVTMAEAREGKEAAFWDNWLERNKDQTYDKRKDKSGNGKPAAKAPPQAGGAGAAAPRASLFGKK
jgi:hypothetical protein